VYESTANGVYVLAGPYEVLRTLKSLTIIEVTMEQHNYGPVHPGEMLLEEFIRPGNLSVPQLAGDLGMQEGELHAFIGGERNVSTVIATALGSRFKTTVQFWLNLQRSYDDRIAADNASELRAGQ
jgi:addiction module HigA family antidote